jgi:IS1 family transposase
MIKIKSFPLDKADEASDFLIEHTPLSTEKQSGIAYTVSHIMIMYDDGVFNYKNMVNKWRNLIGKEIETIEVNKHQIKKNNRYIADLAPKGYKQSMTDVELVKLCEEEGDKHSKALERVKAIVEIENNNLMCSHTVMNAMKEIELYEESIAGYADKH